MPIATPLTQYTLTNGPADGLVLTTDELADPDAFSLVVQEETSRRLSLAGATMSDPVEETVEYRYLRLGERFYLAGMAAYTAPDYGGNRASFLIVCDDPIALAKCFRGYGWNAFSVGADDDPIHDLEVDFIFPCKLHSILKAHAPEAVWERLD